MHNLYSISTHCKMCSNLCELWADHQWFQFFVKLQVSCNSQYWLLRVNVCTFLADASYLQLCQVGSDMIKVKKSKGYPRQYRLENDLLSIVWDSKHKALSKAKSKLCTTTLCDLKWLWCYLRYCYLVLFLLRILLWRVVLTLCLQRL